MTSIRDAHVKRKPALKLSVQQNRENFNNLYHVSW